MTNLQEVAERKRLMPINGQAYKDVCFLLDEIERLSDLLLRQTRLNTEAIRRAMDAELNQTALEQEVHDLQLELERKHGLT